MLGLVLCGGKSKRMGSDKGLLNQEARTWAQTAIDKLTALEIPSKLSVNASQYQVYQSIFPFQDLIQDDEALDVKGPLLGVLSCHKLFPAENLFVLACDMLSMEPFILQGLYEQFLESSADAFVFTNDSEPEPLCGIYRAKGLASIFFMLENKQLTKFSMKFMLDHLNVIKTPLREDQKKYFRNFNAPSELNGL